MDRPKNVDELIAYLKKNPRVHYTNIVNGTYNQERIFNRVDVNGIKWFIPGDVNGFAFTPVYCSFANGKFTFDKDSFSFTAFDVTGRFYYED